MFGHSTIFGFQLSLYLQTVAEGLKCKLINTVYRENKRPKHTHHVCNLEVSIGEDDGVWRRCDRQHKGEGGT